MGLNKNFAAGLFLGLTLTACASIFPYKYYGIDLADQKLKGPTGADDLDLALCAGTDANESPCQAIFTDSFLALKQDYIDTKNQLVACQHQLENK